MAAETSLSFSLNNSRSKLFLSQSLSSKSNPIEKGNKANALARSELAYTKSQLRLGGCFRCGSDKHFVRSCRSDHLYSSSFCSDYSSVNHSGRNAPVRNRLSGRHVFKCFRCGDSNHFAKDCRNLIRCFACGKSGHRKLNCPFIFRGKSTLDLLRFNCSMICQKLISFLNLYDLIISEEKNGGAYMLFVMAWNIEGIVDGVLWREGFFNESRFVASPPLPRPLDRKEHAVSFCVNFLKVRRIFFDSKSKNKKKGLLLLNEILKLFDFINTVVNCGSVAVNRLSLFNLEDGAVLNPVDICNLVVENQLNLDSGDEGAAFVKECGGEFFAEDEMVACVGNLRVLQHFDSMLLDPCVLSLVNQPYESSYVVCPVNVRVDMRCGEMDSSDVCSSSVECSVFCDGTGVEWSVADEVSVQNSFGVLEDVGEEEGIVVKDSGYDIVSDFKGVKQIALDKVVACDVVSDFQVLDPLISSLKNIPCAPSGNAVFSGKGRGGSRVAVGLASSDDLHFDFSQGKLVAPKRSFSFSKHFFDVHMIKRRRSFSVMKHDLWSNMNKGLCMSSMLSGLSNSLGSYSHSDSMTFGDPVSDRLQEDIGEKSPVCDMPFSLARRGRHRRVFPSSRLVRRSTRIRSYTVTDHGKLPS